MTTAERQARRQAKIVTFRPADKAALEAAAAAVGKTTEQLVAEVVAGWLDGGKPPPSPPIRAEDIEAANVLDDSRREILGRLADILARATPAQVQRISDRIEAINAIVP